MRRVPERGFSLIELLIALSIVSVLVRLSIPSLTGMRMNAVAAQAQGDFNTVRAGAVAQYEATGAFPADAPAGVTPAGLAPYLPRGFAFSRREYQLDYEHWTLSDTLGAEGTIIALTVVTTDDRLGRILLHTLGHSSTHWSVGDAHTFVIQSSLESH
jgi:prepilin-type N-terminal cleavage/methylation domain-containing protein